jgi:uncharacterized iron-regulated membrane protein
MAHDQMTKDRPAERARRRQPLMNRPRKSFVRLHRWTAMTVGLWLALQAVTGSVLVFADQINAWSRPELYQSGSGDLGPDAALTTARSAVEGTIVVSLQMPEIQDGVYVAVAIPVPKPGAPSPFGPGGRIIGDQHLVFIDPATAEVNGVRDPNVGFTPWVRGLHGHLLLDHTEILGVSGHHIVGWLGLVSLVILLTGAYVWWWPKVRRWSNLVRWRRKTSMMFQLDLHRAIGIVALPVLILVTLTGLNLSFTQQARKVWYAVTPGADEGPRVGASPVRSALPDGLPGHPVGLERAIGAAESATDGRVVGVGMPAGPEGTYNVRVSNGWDPISGPRGRSGNVNLFVDQYSAEVLASAKPSDFNVAAQTYEYWAFPLHIGSPGRMATRLLWALVGLGTLLLSVSGVVMLRLRLRTKAARAAALRKALPPDLPEPVVVAAQRSAEHEQVSAGTDIVTQGAEADAFYVILAGDFDVLAGEAGQQVLVATLGPGRSFGEIGLMRTGTRTATVRARTDGELVVVPAAEFQRILDDARERGLDLHTAGAAYAATHLDLGRETVAQGTDPLE